MEAAHPPPGWYADPMAPGGARWWDGRAWTHHSRPPPPPVPEPPRPTPPTTSLLEQSSWPSSNGFDNATRAQPAAVDITPTSQPRKRTGRSIGLLATVGAVFAVMAVAGGSGDDSTTTMGSDDSAGSVTTSQTTGSITTAGGTLVPTSVASSSPASTGSATTAPATTAPATSTTEPVAEAETAPPTAAASSDSAVETAPPTTAPTTTASTSTAPPTTAPTTAATPPPTTVDCHPAYSPCLPNLPGDARNCGDFSAAQKPVTVRDVAVDPYQLDGDNDGIGCEGG